MDRHHFYKLQIFIRAAFFILLAAVSIGFAQAPNSLQASELPAPTGSFPVGTDVFHLTDKTRKMPVAAESGRHREIMLQVWYPAEKGKKKAAADYLISPAAFAAMKKEQYLNLKPEVLESWQNIKTHSGLKAPLAKGSERFPLLLFSPGFGMARANYTSILEELASYGYILAAIDHPYTGLTVLPDGRVLSSTEDFRGPGGAAERVESMAQDALFVLDALLNKKAGSGRLAGRIDSQKVGMLGHSLGGAAALEVCRISDRFKACADLDGSVWGKVEEEGVNRPFLVVLNVPAESYRPPEAMRKQRDEEWAAVVSKKKTKAYIVKLEGTFHLSFSDLPFIVPVDLLKKNGADLMPQRGHEIVTGVLREFFSYYFNEKDSTPFSPSIKNFKEAEFKFYN